MTKPRELSSPPVVGIYAQCSPNESIDFGEFSFTASSQLSPHIPKLANCHIVQSFGADETLRVRIPFEKSIGWREILEQRFGGNGEGEAFEVSFGASKPAQLYVATFGNDEALCLMKGSQTMPQ